MSLLRFQVVKEGFCKKAVPVDEPSGRPSAYFGQQVFNREKMFSYLPKKAYDAVIAAIDNKTPLSRETADAVAKGMKHWAMDMGVTHYTHWLHPLTDGTAEKHDSFIEPDGKGGVLEEFSGKLLIPYSSPTPVSRSTTRHRCCVRSTAWTKRPRQSAASSTRQSIASIPTSGGSRSISLSMSRSWRHALTSSSRGAP